LKNLAIIPVRTGSKRLPGKNTKDFFGKPMFMHTVHAAQKSGLFEEIHVSTESNTVIDLCEQAGLSIAFPRPKELASDEARIQNVCEYVLQTFLERGRQFDNFCLLWATAPMRTDEDIRRSYGLMSNDINGVIGVSEYDLPVFCAQTLSSDGMLQPLFEDLLRAPGSEMPEAICDNGSLCWVRTSAFHKQGTWLPESMKGYKLPRNRAVDIDTADDWEWAEFLYRKHHLAE
jgi:pseudaminic acid cytidylyltransferase